MPLSSSQIAQLNGSFQQQYLQQQQYAQSIQPPGYNLGGMNTGSQNEGLAGRGLNTAMGIGAPAATLGLGLMGLDPISMGVRAGMGAGSVGGMGAGLAVGAGVAGIGFAGMGALSYMGNQMMSGAQQTQQFNQGMRGGYSFFNSNSDRGRGFSEGDVRQIGSGVRGMAGGQIGGSFGGTLDQFQLGPSFNELGRLAANMGRMGLADGVRNAKEFTEKFREMVKSVKTIAEDMGTTLEEAQKTMAAMKGSGVFKNQAGVSGAIRGATISGGLATTEVTGMMNIGSQISRMFGGTGRQGAMGGIKAIENVGAAIQTGVLSEEDIYQATGLTGAEGRQAMAQQGLLQTGSFLKSSKGRWLLASLAGKNGKLDAGSVANFAAGGMGVDDTRSQAHKNLAGVGRANFIRNEGRLRGAVMEQFGDMAPAMAMMGWAQGKGIDINSMGDREMLFMQRQMGMGRDEADALVKRARALPTLLQHSREMQQEDVFSREHGLRAQSSGIEGVKRKLEAARDQVNNSLQKVGQDILNHSTDVIAEWGNRLAGTYEETSNEGIADIKRSLLLGGAAGAQAVSRLTSMSKVKGLSGGAGGPHEDVGQRALISRTQELQFNARMATTAGLGSDMQYMLGKEKSNLLASYAASGGLGDLGGEDRIHAFGQALQDPELKAKWKKMNPNERAQFVQQAEGQLGITKNRLSESNFNVPNLPGLVGGGAEHTEAFRNEALGRSVLGMRHDDMMSSASHWGAAGKTLGAAAGGGFGLGLGGLGAVGGFKAGGWLGEKAGNLLDSALDMVTGRTAKAQAAGAYLRSGEGSNLSYDVFANKEGVLEDIHLKIANLKRGGTGNLSPDEQAQLESLQKLEEGARIIKSAGGYDRLSQAQKDKLGPLAQGAKDVQSAKAAKVREQISRTSEQEGQLLRAGGVAHLENGALVVNADTEANLLKKGGKGAVQGLRLAMAAQSAEMRAGQGGSFEGMETANTGFSDWMAHASVKDLRAVAVQAAGTARGGLVSESLMRGTAIDRTKGKLGAAGSLAANMLNMNLSADELTKLKGMKEGDQAAWLASKAGLGQDESFTKGLKESIVAASKKGGGVAGGILLQNTLDKDETARKKLEAASSGKQSPEEKIVEKIAEGNTYLKQLAIGDEKSKRVLQDIASNTSAKKDAEK